MSAWPQEEAVADWCKQNKTTGANKIKRRCKQNKTFAVGKPSIDWHIASTPARIGPSRHWKRETGVREEEEEELDDDSNNS